MVAAIGFSYLQPWNGYMEEIGPMEIPQIQTRNAHDQASSYLLVVKIKWAMAEVIFLLHQKSAQ